MGTEDHALLSPVGNRKLVLSGERIVAHYSIQADSSEKAESRAKDICLEETVELPASVIPPESDIGQYIIGNIESLLPDGGRQNSWKAKISFAAESAGSELPQLLNLLFGNISIKPGIRLDNLELPPSILNGLPGPRLGTGGLRDRLQVYDRPLLCTALKPMGLSADELASLAYQFALGGMDIIKDDHGITGQSFAPFEERVEKCAAAVRRANEKTGFRSIYMPSITAPADQILKRAHFAADAGAGGFLVTPGLSGFDSLRMIREDSQLDLPMMAHPSFLGSFTANEDSGISHGLVYGLLPRLAGADAVVFPNSGGRFSFSTKEVEDIARQSLREIPGKQNAFPVPAGGMTLDRVEEMIRFYGKDAIFLMGGGLYAAGPDLSESTRQFLKAVSS